MKSSYIIICLSIAVLVAACAAEKHMPQTVVDEPPGGGGDISLAVDEQSENMSGSPPEWLYGQSSAYPESDYLTGYGRAGNLDVAQDRARADLAKIFSVAIEADISDVQRFRSGTIEPENQIESSVMRRVMAHTSTLLSGIEIVDTWYAPHSKTYHTLAALSRNKAKALFKQELLEYDGSIIEYMSQREKSDDVLNQLSYVDEAVKLMHERDKVYQKLQIVDAEVNRVPLQWQKEGLITHRDDLLRSLKVSSEVKQNNTNGIELENMLEGALSKTGITVVEGSAADFLLKTTIDLDSRRSDDEWYWVRGSLSIELAESKTGLNRGTYRWLIKSSAMNRTVAMQRAIDRINRVLNEELGGAIISFGGKH